MLSKYQLNYCRALVIAHGASEYQIASYIKRNLRLPLEIVAKDNGRHSIQINGLVDQIQKLYPTQKEFQERITAKVEGKRIVDFYIFPIMDTDDCAPPSLCDKYKDKSIFNGLWFKPYIYPIYNSPSLEYILYKAEIIEKMLSDDEKMQTYHKIFPLDKNSPLQAGLGEVEKFRDRICNIKNTNLNDFIDYCIEWATLGRINC